jgi:hypothetical protein
LANLWCAAARALGFEIGTIRCPDQLLVRLVSTLCPGVKSLVPLPGRLRPPQNLPDIVFSDLGSLPLGPDSGEYWGAWLTPHLFFFDGTDDGVTAAVGPGARVSPAPPQGWTSQMVCLSHADTGGSTSGRWVLALWYPPGYPWVEPLTWEPRGGTPLLCCGHASVRGDGETCRTGERLCLGFWAVPGLGPHGSSATGVLREPFRLRVELSFGQGTG